MKFIAFFLAFVSTAIAGSFEFEKLEDRVVVSIGGETFTEYRFKERRPCFYPVFGPDGRHQTRRWPFEEGFKESTDHPHHSGLWFAHGEVRIPDRQEPFDFWHHDAIEHERFVDFEGNAEKDTLVALNNWQAKDGTLVCRDRQTMCFGHSENLRWIDFTIDIFTSLKQPVVLGDTKEGTFAIRVPEELSMEAYKKKYRDISQGKITTSEGIEGGDAWGSRARWVAYHGELEGKPAVIAMFDHQSNPVHPTWWVARPYGVFGANATGVSYFEGKPKGTGDLEIPAGKSVKFRYRVLFLSEPFDAERIEKLYQVFNTYDRDPIPKSLRLN